jgi:glycosyltransferase involved in cell wall biosynthesis
MLISKLDPTHILIPSNFEHPLDAIRIGGTYFKNTAVLIHDLIPLHYKKDLLPGKTQQRRYEENLIDAILAKIVLTNSIYTKNDLIRITGRKDKLVNIGGAGFFSNNKKIVSPRQRRSGILCIGADTKHKNMEGLVDAYLKIPEALRADCPLVMVGIKNNGLVRELKHKIKNKPGEIIFYDFVDDEELENLYSSSLVTIVPSFIEGLRMPIVESWSHGTPVIASANSVMSEIISQNEMTFDPSSPLDISITLSKILSVESFWVDQQNWLLQRRLEFSWDLVAERLDNWISSDGKNFE